MSAEPRDAGSGRRRQRRVVAAAITGTTIAWYDFFLFTIAVPIVIYPRPAPAVAAPVLALLMAGFVGRVAGGAVFGHLGDRQGRRATLVATLLTAGLPTVAIGLLPDPHPAAAWSVALLVALRVVQGAGVGGEWAGAVLMAMECEPDRARRGLAASLPQVGVPLGLLLAASALAATRLLPAASFGAWGWRVPFLLGAPLLAVCLGLRRRLPETPDFERWRATRPPEPRPVARVVRHHWHQVGAAARARLSTDVLFYGCVFAGIAIGSGRPGSDPGLAMVATLAATAAATLAIPLAGWLSDRHGRGPVYGGGIVAVALVAIPIFGALDSGPRAAVLVAVVAAAIVHAIQYGPQAALIAESFVPRLRYSGAALAYQLGSVPAALLVPAAVVFVPAHALGIVAVAVVGCCLASASALVPPRWLLWLVAALAVAGAASQVAQVAAPAALVALLVDGRSPLWLWLNNLGTVLGLLGIGAWLLSLRRPRAS